MSTQHIPELINDPSSGPCLNEFGISDIWVIDSYNPGDWNGIISNISLFYSDTPGYQFTLDLSNIGNVSVSYCNFQDVNVIGGIIFADETCSDLGNTSGISWAMSNAQLTWIF